MSWTEHFFLSRDGTINCDETDFKRFCATMPIPLREAPASFFDHGPVDGFNPPLLWLGWRISAQRAFDIVKERYKDKVFDTAEGPNEYFTVSGLAEYVCDEFNIAPEDRCCIHLVDVGDDDGKRALALTAGNNFPRTIPILEVYIRIQNELFGGEEPKWYLCSDQFHWTEADDCPKAGDIEELRDLHRKERAAYIEATQAHSAT